MAALVGALVGVAVGVLIGILTPVIRDPVTRWLGRWIGGTRTEVTLEMTPDLEALGCAFHVRHVRDGRDDSRDLGSLRNRDFAFRPSPEPNVLVASFRHSMRKGAQFKCFADGVAVRPSAMEAFRRARMEPALDTEVPDRVWFLLPDYPVVDTSDGYQNNYTTFRG